MGDGTVIFVSSSSIADLLSSSRHKRKEGNKQRRQNQGEM